MKNISDKIIRAYALKNALEHGGKAHQGSVLSPLFNEGLEKGDIKEIMPRITTIIAEVNKLSESEQKKEFEKLEEHVSRRSEREGLQELPNAVSGKVVTRIAPSPSGPMHIGHAATGMPSSLYAKEYKGKFIVRIEDTNPENIYEKAYDMLVEECDWLFGNVTEYVIQSDRIPIYYSYVETFLEKDSVYVCDCDPDTFKELITKKKECPCRNLGIEEQKKRWKRMLQKSGKDGYKEGEAVLRFKSDVHHKNPALRDFPLARINEAKHPRQGKTYRVWPLMNLSVCVDDIEFGSTHIIRAQDHQDNALRQEMMFEALGKKVPETMFMGKYHFTDLEISASKTREKIAAGEFDGWDDIRLPFMAALKKRGFQPEAFALMAIQRGVNIVDKKLTKDEYLSLIHI